MLLLLRIILLENGKYKSIDPSKIELKYEYIRKNTDLLIVDNYSIDVYHETIRNCFDDIFYTGSDIDVDNLLNVGKKHKKTIELINL